MRRLKGGKECPTTWNGIYHRGNDLLEINEVYPEFDWAALNSIGLP